tara:strand:+ start:251 stop:466 length:216 start_codon:yes stop_codon:yes gene_type:complete
MYVKAWRFPDGSSFHFVLDDDTRDIRYGVQFDTENTARFFLDRDDAIKYAWKTARDKTKNFTVKELGPVPF